MELQRGDPAGVQTLLDERLAPKSMRFGAEENFVSRYNSIDIPWSPPVANWNPWTFCKLERGYYATVFRSKSSKKFIVLQSFLKTRYGCAIGIARWY